MISRLYADLRYAAFHILVNIIAASAACPRDLRLQILKALGARGTRANIYPGVLFRTGRLVLGRNVFINTGCRFDNVAQVSLGDDVSVGPDVCFYTTTHEVHAGIKKAGALYCSPIHVGNGTWIGARSAILPGVIIADSCVIAAGSVVTRNLSTPGLYAGVPAVLKRPF